MAYGREKPTSPPRPPQPETVFDKLTNYADYSGLKWVHNAQHPRSFAHDEIMFMISGQVLELWFRLLKHELGGARERIRADDLPMAFKMMARAKRVLETMTTMWSIMDTMTPTEFGAFRDYLGDASGFHSYMYRHVEYIMGTKSFSMAKQHEGTGQVFDELMEALHQPSLYDEALRLLARRGVPVPAEALERDWSLPYKLNQGVEDAWLTVFEDARPANELYQLVEELTDLADIFGQWRQRHVTSVERQIGYKTGTAGTSGVEFLRRIAQQRFFPELWTVRTRL